MDLDTLSALLLPRGCHDAVAGIKPYHEIIANIMCGAAVDVIMVGR